MLMAEFLTAVHHDLPVKVFINNNGSFGQILWEQMVLGYPEFGVRHKGFADFAPWAESCGGLGIKVAKSGDLDDAVGAALAYKGAALVDCDVNPNEPPMPGVVSREQTKGFAKAFLRGQPHKAEIVETLVADEMEKFSS
jgi:pyruvate dehydrogenase (quinone)